MREIVLDTETTGLSPAEGHRVVEIGAVELINHLPTGDTFHRYLNPDRDMPKEAEAVHGLSAIFLSGQPRFKDVARDFLAFIGESGLIIHNASFDMAFLNWELTAIGRPPLAPERVTDTLMLARKKHPMGPNSLDALCKRYGVDASRRDKHGALLDSELLASVYLELIGGKQRTLVLASGEREIPLANPQQFAPRSRQRPLLSRLSVEEEAAHARHVKDLGAPTFWPETSNT